MKIGIEVQRLFRKKKFGIESSSLELIKKLKEVERGHEYVIFAKNDEDRNCLTDSPNLKIKIVDGRMFADFEQFFLPVAVAREHVDLLHCTGNTTPYFSPVPVVQTLHDVIFMDCIPENDTYYQRFGNYYRRKIVPAVTPRSNAVITVSEYEKERILNRLPIDPAKIHVVHNGIDEKRFYPSADAAAKKLALSKYRLPDAYILFLGNASVRKNAERVLEAYVAYARRSENPIPLVTPGLSEKFLSDKLKESGFPFEKDQLFTPGYISNEDLPLIYGLSKIFLFPSLSEGFGMPVIEAMACGAPVITSNISSMPEIAGNAALLVDPRNTVEITDALIALSTNERFRNQKISEGFVNAKRFSWGRSAEKVLDVYEAVYRDARAVYKTPRFSADTFS